MTPAIRAGLVAAFAAGRHLDPAFVASVVSGSVRYAYDPIGRRDWALADFSASAAAQRAHEDLDGSAADPLVEFQDGPMIFSRATGGSWTFVSDTGGLICPPRPPAAVLAHWSINTTDCKS